jgi:hypothetical protein
VHLHTNGGCAAQEGAKGRRAAELRRNKAGSAASSARMLVSTMLLLPKWVQASARLLSAVSLTFILLLELARQMALHKGGLACTQCREKR